jgi:thioredoxin reductase
LYLDYAAWFQGRQGIAPLPLYVQRLEHEGRGAGRLRATLEDGHSVGAEAVVLAMGCGAFAHVPPELAELMAALPGGRVAHTRDLVDFAPLTGAHCLIVGGRQSAFEWAALVREQGAAAVHVVHRHATPAFAPADWSWVSPLMEQLAADPGRYRRLLAAERDALEQRLWAEGRLKLEPWLAPRLAHETIHLWPHARITGCARQATGELAVRLDSGQRLAANRVILATGYKVNMARLPLLAESALARSLATRSGAPVLDESFQTSIPGLFATGMMATGDFGSFLAFTVAARAAATVIGRAVERRLAGDGRGSGRRGGSARTGASFEQGAQPLPR